MFGAVPDREPRQRKKVWPRDLLEAEVRAMCAAQQKHFPALTEEKVNWLLFGAAAEYVNKADGALHHVIRRGRSEASKNPGLYSLRYPRFDNRHPGLDLLTPFDKEGRPIYVARKNKPEAKAALFEQAIFNFRVIEKATGRKVTPDAASIARLREIYESSRRKKTKTNKPGTLPGEASGPESVEITTSVLKKWYADYASRYQEIDDTNELKASLGTGRAKFCRSNLKKLHDDFVAIASGDMAQASIQPLLRDEKESKQQARDRFFSDIRHRLVQHRIRLFTRLLADLIEKHGAPQYIVYEAVRTLALSRKKKEELGKERQKKEKERQRSIDDLRDNSRSTSKNAIQRHRLFHETGGKCPFCLGTMMASDLHNGTLDIAHLFPRAWAACNEWWNLTVSHASCNRVDMQNQIPRDAWRENWSKVEDNAHEVFRGKKLELFLAADKETAEALVRPGGDLAQTAYISKMVRRACLIELDWLHKGRDPVGTEGVVDHPGVVGLKLTNGQITASLRRGWGLDAVLHPRPARMSEAQEGELTTEQRKARWQEKKEVFEKNRGDHRHHAIDAMVIACTWPARALHVHSITKEGVEKEFGWRWDERRQQMLAFHPLYNDHRQMRRVVEDWMQRLPAEERLRHHVSTSQKKKGYELTFLSGIRYDKQDPTATGYYKREKVEKLTIRKIMNTVNPGSANYLYPVEMGEYLRRQWAVYARDMGDYLEAAAGDFAPVAQADEKLSAKKNEEIESAFLGRLCFGAFAAWQSGDRSQPVVLPEEARSAVRPLLEVTVRLQRPQDDGSWSFVWQRKKSSKKIMPALREAAFKKLPPDFMNRQCFAAFQKWRAPLEQWERDCKKGETKVRPVLPDPSMPVRVTVPIKSLRVLVTENPAQLAPASVPGRNGGTGFVERKEYREVRLLPVKSRKDEVVPVFYPMWRSDAPYCPFYDVEKVDMAAKPRAVFRKRQIVKLVADYNDRPAGNYVLLALNPSGKPHLSPPHVASTPQAQLAFGLSKSGWKPKWTKLIPCLSGGLKFPADASESDAAENEEEAEDED